MIPSTSATIPTAIDHTHTYWIPITIPEEPVQSAGEPGGSFDLLERPQRPSRAAGREPSDPLGMVSADC